MGILCIVAGGQLLYEPTWISKYGIIFDVSDYQVPFAFSMIFVGIFSVWMAAKSKLYTGNDILMCPQCNQPIERKQTQGNKCPTCDVELEPLDGFYDRHPEFKGK